MLPTPLTWLKKILAILKSNLSPNQIGLSFALGIFAGLPPMGLHVLIPATFALLFRCSFRAFLISMGLFRLISLAVTPGSYAVGKWLLDSQHGLDSFWRWLFHLPVIAPMGYSRYLLFGSLVMALVMAIPTFLLIRLLVDKYRHSFAVWVSGWRASRWLKGRRGTKLARKLVTGGATKYELKPPPTGIFRFIRREMLIGLPVLYMAAFLIAAVIVPFFAGTVATSTASWLVGAEVTVSDSKFNLFTGGLTLTDLTIQDPQAPDENLIVIPKLTVDAGMLPLISNRVVFNSVLIADAELHVKREPDGTLNIDNPSSGWNADGYLEWAARYADRVDWLGLMRHLLDYLGQWQPPAPPQDHYAAFSGGRSLPGFRPPFEIQRLEIGRVLVTLEDETAANRDESLPRITLLEIEVHNLAFPPALRTEPIQLTLRGQWDDDPDSGFQLAATFIESDDSLVSSYEFALKRFDLPRLASFYATTLPVRIVSGWASVTGSLRLEGETASGTVSFLLEELAIDPITEYPLFGLPAGTSAQVIKGINRYAAQVPIVFGAAIEGSSAAPRLAWETPLLEIARQGLIMEGKRELNRIIEQLGVKIDHLGGMETIPLDSNFEAVQQRAESAVRSVIEQATGGILPDLPIPGDSTGTVTDAAPDNEGQTDLSDLLPGLLDKLLDMLIDPASENEQADQAANPE